MDIHFDPNIVGYPLLLKLLSEALRKRKRDRLLPCDGALVDYWLCQLTQLSAKMGLNEEICIVTIAFGLEVAAFDESGEQSDETS
jgi:hypothetical protein